MKNDRWEMNRAGLVNFWYYDEEEFDFSNGKLLLRGSNGSGKSVTMQSFIPLILDGNKSPERLDPFGSRARKIENYLLGEDDSDRNESIGYVYMEFQKEKSEKHLSIGMGLKAKRGKPVSFWGFVITDGRRIGKDFLLYKDMGEKVPLSKKELKNRVGDGGEVREGQKEYMELVNKYLFGFDEIDDYDELIKLLIQLRTPKLSKNFKPTVIYEIMNNSLQSLSDDDLRPMSEAIENMDNIKNRLEELKANQKAAQKLKYVYDQYNRYIIFEKAKKFTKSHETLRKLTKEQDDLQNNRDVFDREFSEYNELINELETKESIFKDKKRELEKHDSYKLREEIAKLETEINELNEEIEQKEDSLNKKKDKERELFSEIKEHEQKESNEISVITNELDEMDSLANSFKFDEQFFMKDELLRDLEQEYDFTYIKNQISTYREKIVIAKKELHEEHKKNKEYDDALLMLEKSKSERNNHNKQLEKANLLISETKEEFIENMYKWQKSNIELKIPKDAMVGVTQKVNLYGDKVSYDDIITDIRKVYNDYEGRFNKDTSKLINLKENYLKEKNEKNEEIQAWQNKKDPEPEREKKIVLNRERLINERIPFIPFFMAVDFQDNLSEEEKGRLEESLIDMGILDALIIPSQYKQKVLKADKDMADKYLFSSPKLLKHELTQKLKVDKLSVDGINKTDIEDVLQSVLLDEEQDATFINEYGEFGIGVLRGKASNNYKSRFIGSSSRKRYREEIILLLSSHKEEIEKNINETIGLVDDLKVRIDVLNNEYSQFPDKNDLEVALKEVKEAKFHYENSLKVVTKRETEAEDIYKLLKEVKTKVFSLTKGMEISLNLKAYEDAEEDANDYKVQLAELERYHLLLLQSIKSKETAQNRKSEIDIDIDGLHYDITKLERKLKRSKEKRKSNLEQLDIHGYEEIKNEIQRCIELLDKLPQDIKTAVEKKTQAKSNYEQTIEQLEKIKIDIDFQRSITKIHNEGFREEYLLEYVYTKREESDLYKIAKNICNELKDLEKQNKNKSDYTETLQERYHSNRQYLTEYNLRIEHTFEKKVDGENEEILKVIRDQKRLEIMGRIRGKYSDLYSLVDYIEEGIEENEKLLKESDRQMFEDILAKNISKKIRAKIYHSEEWVKKMNKLMESMNTSSGLSFSLSWRSNSAESEEQLDTKELVELLRKDGNLLLENEINRLSSHFRSKIAEARRNAEEKGKNQTFHAIMKEVLDYRKWFEFRLHYKKTNETKREMTNNAFDKFSGGEKAMAMYVPLFSAVYAKYEGARKDCPRIISLDEAFAGVDEKNIRDMFRLLNELELNYIINSQILWGDYDTVPSLSICELVRPNNATYVTVLRYTWNGEVKELVLNEGEDYEQTEVAATM